MSTQPAPETTRHLARLAEKLRADPAYMAGTLFAFQMQEKLDDAELARSLKLQLDQLPRLALCKRPLPRNDSFAEQVRQIANYSGADPVTLVQIIRQVDSLEQMKNLPSTTQMVTQNSALPSPSGLVAAARDTEELDSVHPSDGESPEGDEPRS